MPNKPTIPATAAQRKKLLAAINRLLKDHSFSSHKIVEIKVQPRSVNNLTGNSDGLVCETWQKPTEVILPDGSTEWICWPPIKPSN